VQALQQHFFIKHHIGMLGFHISKHLFHAVRQRFIGCVLIGIHRIAPGRRHQARIQDRKFRRCVRVLQIRMPAPTDILFGLFGFMELHHVIEAGHVIGLAADFGEQFRRKLFQRAEPLAESAVLLRCDILVAKEQDLMIQDRLVNFGKCFIIERRQIDAANLGPKRTRDGRHLEGLKFVLNGLRLNHKFIMPKIAVTAMPAGYIVAKSVPLKRA
jgi:hypothetical protein